jgi:hypothetical protein
MALMPELFDRPVYLKDGTCVDSLDSTAKATSNALDGLRQAVRWVAENYRPDQPRDSKGRFAHVGGPGVGHTPHPLPPVVLTKTQRESLTKAEDQQWRAAWKERAALKASIKKETDTHKRGQMERRVEELTQHLQKLRDVGKQRSEGAVGKKQTEDDLLKKHGEGEKEGKSLDRAAEAQKMVSALQGLATGSGVDLIHLGALRGEMRHLSKEQFDEVMHHARREGTITLTGAERGSGAPEFDKKHAIYEKDPVTGLDSMLLYASLRGGARGAEAGGGTGGVKSGLTRQEVTDRIRAAGAKAATGFGAFHMQDEALRMMGEHGREVGDVTRHGMADAEKMHQLEIGGIKFQWPGNHPDAQRNAAQSIADIMSETSGAVPDKLWNANKSVVFSTQRNKDDDHWAQEYGIPGFRAGATGGDGHVVFYGTDKRSMSYDTFSHESGHNLANSLWGQTSPPAHTDYGKAQKREKPVSSYGAKSPAEDFAEASKQYSNIFTRTEFKSRFPLKYAAFRALLGEPPEPVS